MFGRFIVFQSLLGLLALFVTAATHPTTGYPPMDFPGNWTTTSTRSAKYSHKDLTFTGVQPAWEELTDAEKYIVAGSRGSTLTDKVLPSWTTEVFFIVMRFYERNGYIPDQLTPEMLRQSGVDGIEERLDMWRNPITGEWPRLNAATHSPGDVYIRPLTLEEMRHIASISPYYDRIWFDGQADNPKTGQKDRPAKLTSDVFYLRIYGVNAPIVQAFKFVYSVD